MSSDREVIFDLRDDEPVESSRKALPAPPPLTSSPEASLTPLPHADHQSSGEAVRSSSISVISVTRSPVPVISTDSVSSPPNRI